MDKSLKRQLLGEFIGCVFLTGLGLQALAIAITTGALDFLGALIIFVFAVCFAVIYVAPLSGAHLNPAITIALAAFAGFPKEKVLPFIIIQVFGCFVGGLLVYFFWSGAIIAFEAANGIVRGAPGSELTAMIFACFSPHPFIAQASGWSASVVPTWKAILVEVLGTGMLALSVFSFNDPDNDLGPKKGMFGFMIGLVLLIYVAIAAPLTMGAVNPARDFGPRLAAYLLGWGNVVLPGPASGVGGPFYIYWVGPILGGLAAGLLYFKVIKPNIIKEKLAAQQDGEPSSVLEDLEEIALPQ
jgi:glycerol uptake facilitator protein